MAAMDHHKYSTSNPSFSSTLLDAIYRSIDEPQGEGGDRDRVVLYRETMRKKQSSLGFNDEEEMANYQRACLIEKWMEKKVVVRRNFQRKEEYDASSACTFFNSTSSSSDSSCGGGFSSSEAESIYGVSSSSARGATTCYGLNKPKPIRTGVSALPRQEKSHLNLEKEYNNSKNFPPKAKQEGSFMKTKSRALKIYGDLKKVKQPISPGGRLASFLNSIFTTGNTKKESNSERKMKSANASTCSSASSFSRSCLSKTPSSRGKSGNNNINGGLKRSVRFYPVSVIVDEDCQPCGQKSLYDDDTVKKSNININEEIKFHVLEKNRRVEEAARDLLRNFQKRVVDQCDYNMIRNGRIDDQEFHNLDVDDEDEDEDDAASYASSDLFELDNLSAIGMERYREELPVYETTNLGTNRAIANGLIL